MPSATRDRSPSCRPSTTPSLRFARPWSSTSADPRPISTVSRPSRPMVAVLWIASWAAIAGRPVLEGLGEDGLLTPERWPKADSPGDRRRPPRARGLGTGRQHRPAQASRSLARGSSRRPRGCAVRSASIDRLAARRAGGHSSGSACRPPTRSSSSALKRPRYPVDRATFRVLVRHGWLDSTATYDEARDLLVDHAHSIARCGRDEDAASRADRAGSRHGDSSAAGFCRAAAPRCDGCPLERLLPEGGPREVDA